jgi:hypothetical protein
MVKYDLFPKLNFFDYVRRCHIRYHPGRPKTEVVRCDIIHVIIMVIVIYGKSSGGVWRALCTLKGCTSALLRVATLKGP